MEQSAVSAVKEISIDYTNEDMWSYMETFLGETAENLYEAWKRDYPKELAD